MRSTILLRLLFGCLAIDICLGVNPLEQSKDGLLSRRVRALIFPNKASVLITAALTKIVVGGRPTGLQYSLEFDMYVPLPDTVEGWRPKIHPGHKLIKAKPRWDWAEYNRNTTSYTHNPPDRKQSAYYYGPYQAATYANYVKQKTHKDYFYKSPWQFTEEPWQRHRQTRGAHVEEEEIYESWSHVPSWKLNRGYRERREIFDQLEAMGNFFQLDFRSCIKRAMCEFQARFNEDYGSGMLMEDLMRIILTVPEDIADEKYQHRLEARDCARIYAVSCPYKILDFLSKTQ